MEQEKKFYTLIVFSENFAGLLNQVTAVFTRRQVNIDRETHRCAPGSLFHGRRNLHPGSGAL